jgi:hypothetical protein
MLCRSPIGAGWSIEQEHTRTCASVDLFALKVSQRLMVIPFAQDLPGSSAGTNLRSAAPA